MAIKALCISLCDKLRFNGLVGMKKQEDHPYSAVLAL